jgi:hypothetical protein
MGLLAELGPCQWTPILTITRFGGGGVEILNGSPATLNPLLQAPIPPELCRLPTAKALKCSQCKNLQPSGLLRSTASIK